ncbi:hypothetical protein N4S13_20370 (plasmid) [Enterococcus raffinosus]|uniref:hypothetical protein n=1 Tax=Enterococcus TaxID=1350 RepID=UPI0009F64B2A|nr:MULTISPECIES: hypothetical protein [Enterococcus]MDU6574723.1 hypothetical protein [Enterococcus raffinosus]UXC27514.1 hypothetical protein N4S13_20370 [Enterococcus raffinosus]
MVEDRLPVFLIDRGFALGYVDCCRKSNRVYRLSFEASASVAVYRLYNPNAKAGAHHYTPNSNERDHLVQVGWRSEGVGFYAETAE